mgnify:CR=1 FL=1
MHKDKNILLLSMPFAGINIPSIQLALLETYLIEKKVNVKTCHLYLKAAEIYGLNNYNLLTPPPNDSYVAQMAFSKYVFQDHFNQKKEEMKKYYDENIVKNRKDPSLMDFENNIKKTDEIYNFTLKNINWEEFDLIGFSLNYGQLLPSLAIAKKIKQIFPNKEIVFGGSRTVGRLGIKALELFPFIDFIVSGDGEDSLYYLSKESIDKNSILGLIYRKNGSIRYNDLNNNIDLDSLHIPNYDSFYRQLSITSSEVKQNFMYNGYMPVEISRGCFWNKCSFCNMNIQHKKYREKSVDKIVEEIDFLSSKYKILNFQLIGNTLPFKNFRKLFEKIKLLNKDLNFVAETRAGRLKQKDYKLMKDAGFRIIQTGVESFSQNYLNKMKKGVDVIDNIAALKFSMENSIQNHYNIIINYPNEEKNDFEESKEIIDQIKSYIDPPKISQLRVAFGNDIFNNPYNYEIKELTSTNIDRLMFPPKILNSGFNFVYSFKTDNKNEIKKWYDLINSWNKLRNELIINGTNTRSDVDKYIFYFLDGKDFVKIVDKRDNKNINIFILDQNERKVFLNCLDAISFDKLNETLTQLSTDELSKILVTLVKNKIIFKENDKYLSLPLDYQKIIGKNFVNKSDIKEKNSIII